MTFRYLTMIILFVFAAGCKTCHARIIFLLSIANVNFCQWVTVHTVLAVSGVSHKCNYNLGTGTFGILYFVVNFKTAALLIKCDHDVIF
jgi:hypothetical protein